MFLLEMSGRSIKARTAGEKAAEPMMKCEKKKKVVTLTIEEKDAGNSASSASGESDVTRSHVTDKGIGAITFVKITFGVNGSG